MDYQRHRKKRSRDAQKKRRSGGQRARKMQMRRLIALRHNVLPEDRADDPEGGANDPE